MVRPGFFVCRERRLGRPFDLSQQFLAKIRKGRLGRLHIYTPMNRFEITVRYVLAALLAGAFTAGVIYIYITYR